jgi:class 3 adenylate cyclase
MIEVSRGVAGDDMPTIDDVTPEDIAFYLDTESMDVPELRENTWLRDETARLEAIIAGDDECAGAMARAHLAVRLTSTDPVRARELASTAIEIGEALAEHRVLAAAKCSFAWASWLWYSTDSRIPSGHALEAEYLAHDSDLRVWEALAMTLRMHLMVGSGLEASAVSLQTAIVQHLRHPGNENDEPVRLLCMAWFCFIRALLAGNLKVEAMSSNKHLALAVAYARAIPEPSLVAHAHQRVAWTARNDKQYATAKDHITRESLIGTRQRSAQHRLLAMQLLASIHTEERNFVAAEDVLEDAESELASGVWVRPLVPMLVKFRRVQLFVARKRWNEAETLLDEIAPQTERSLSANVKVMLETYIEIYRAQGTLHEHLDMYDRLLEHIQRMSDEREQRQALEGQRQIEMRNRHQRVDSALRAVLPEHAYHELAESGESEPRHYPKAVVFTSDFAGFTRIASALTPRQVIEELSDLFANFDSIMSANECDRVETIGDAYLAVAGLRSTSPAEVRIDLTIHDDRPCEDAHRMARAAIAIQAYLGERNKRASELGGSQFVARIGLHSGPIVGGVVGRDRIRYGIFGDAVNTSQRLEAACKPGEVSVSEVVFSMLGRESSSEFKLSPAGEITPKGKGPMKVWTLGAR